MLSVVTDDGSTQPGSLIDEIVREGARRMLAAALEAEVNQNIAQLAAETDEYGGRLVVRNGHHKARTLVTAAGPVEVKAPRINNRRVDDETGERKRFASKILPPWCRRSPKISEVLPLLYLHGLSSGDFVPARHWIHLRTTNPIEPTFSTVKLRTKVTRGVGSPAATLAMVFKLVESAQARWCAITGAHLVSLVRAGARFENGVLVERGEQAA
ncbi:transposase [Streptomyces sp. NPDC018610]|uniref:transposase n=1 Tax=Streptomyces sp. NPDC018610 TaxID=3365049 RepID=UPI003796490C